MNVYTTKTKRVVNKLDLTEVKDSIKSWAECRTYIRSLKLTSRKKLTNWYSYLLCKRINRKEKTNFNFYLKRVLQKKPLQNTVLKGVILHDY